MSTTYYIYHEGIKEHLLITPCRLPIRKSTTLWHQPPPPVKNSYFIHVPFLSFHNPPRTLRRGNSKHSTPICLINEDWFWKRWNLQFGDEEIEKVLDPRGVVKWEHRSQGDNKRKDDCALKGYKVRKWRCWLESGRPYHEFVNARRKRMIKSGEKEEEIHEPIRAEEAVSLNWALPVSWNTRCYRFRYGDIDFAWKGTRDIPRKWHTRFLPFNHLKLVASVPVLPGYDAKDAAQEVTKDTLLAQYTCSFRSDKYGKLVVFDSAISNLVHQFDIDHGKDPPEDQDLHLTRLYDVIMATAMCMVMGEWEKRQIVIGILLLALSSSDVWSNS